MDAEEPITARQSIFHHTLPQRVWCGDQQSSRPAAIGFGGIAIVEFSSLFGHLPKLEDLQICPAFTTVSADPPASDKFRLILDPGCSCMTSLVKLTCYGNDESLVVTGPVTVFPILEECILRHYQETATSEVLEWFENWDMAAFRAQKAVKPAAEGVKAQQLA